MKLFPYLVIRTQQLSLNWSHSSTEVRRLPGLTLEGGLDMLDEQVRSIQSRTHSSGNDGMTSFGDHAFDKMDEHSYQCYHQQS